MRLRPALLLALAACATAPRTAAPGAPTDEAAVYGAVLDHLGASSRAAVVLDSTAEARRPVGEAVQRGASAELASSFAEANRAPRALPRPLPATPPVRFARRGELPFFSGEANPDVEANWRRFHELFPGSGGFYEFSAIGFDAARSTAVVYVAHSCGSLCGTGSLVTLRRTAGRWQVAEAAMLWVS